MADVTDRLTGGLPDNYMVLDTETTGVSPDRDRVVQLGVCDVTSRRVSDVWEQIINHPGVEIPDGAAKVHHISTERMRREGAPACEVLAAFFSLLEAVRKAGKPFVGHNAVSFDARILEAEARRCGHTFVFGPNEIIDTGAIVKASQLGMYFERNDTLRSFAARVGERRAPGVYWSLDRYCFDEFSLGRSGIMKTAAHGAGTDCLLTHMLLETLRAEVEPPF
jgi:DNA polymerase-3 subunit epsilon